jgi:uncharacterized protein (TIRG00374 family)
MIGSFHLGTFATILALATAGIVLRSLRWRWLMGQAGYPVGISSAFYLQLSGLAASVTPARAGEIIKPWLSRDISGMPMSSGIALVFAERVADLIAVCVLSLGALSLLGAGVWVFAGVGLAVIGLVWVASSGRLHGAVVRVLSRHRLLKDRRASLETISKTIRRVLRVRVLAPSAMVSIAVWGFEGVGFVLCLRALGFDGLPVAAAVSLYAVSVLVGALTFLPAGVGLTEASMAGLLIGAGMAGADASAATIIMRLATLWWGVALGWGALAARPGRLRGIVFGQDRTGLPTYNGSDD